jgi:superfamily II DNA or RNA helicase
MLINQQVKQLVNGYVISNEIDTIQMRKKLTVQPKHPADYGPPPKSFQVYKRLTCGELLVPRFFLHEFYPELADKDPLRLMNSGESIDIEFKGELREEQKPIIDAMLIGLTDQGGGIIAAGCGTGKTAMADYLIVVLKKKALIIVHNEFLLEQHVERLQQFTNARIGYIQGKKVIVEDCDVVIGMLQSISMKTFEDGFFDQFGTIVVDECHHIAARVFSRALFKISSQYMIGLSATPNRNDGLSKVFHWFLGPIRYSKKVERDLDIDVRMVKCKGTTPWHQMRYNFKKKANVPTMLTKISEYPARTNWIASQVVQLAKEGRQILILTHRRNHVTELAQILTDRGFPAGIMMGATKKKDKELRKESLNYQVIVGTYQMVSEGFDCEKLDTLVMASPIKDITQPIGRILRKKTYKLQPLIIDVVDDFGTFKKHSSCRKTQYRKAEKPNCNISIFEKDLEDDQVEFFGNYIESGNRKKKIQGTETGAKIDPDPDVGNNNDTYQLLKDNFLL